MPQTIYRKSRVSPRAWALPVVLWVIAAVVIVVFFPGVSTSATVLAATLPTAIVLAIWLLTLWSMNRYGSLRLTAETLFVGRDTVPVDQIDPASVHGADSRPPGALERTVTSAATVQPPGQGPTSADMDRLLGGAYGSTLGDDVVVIRMRNGSRYGVPTTDRARLLAALREVVPTP
ncbi:DUF3093 family protein [Nocardioides mangrovicus]|uniref:DUF3093 family protein n=1 Tax=Nocardioides mangrovicus TaxID=2478913 RepID=UPI001314E544|nr:DUF3093 family protein [Nocardioides mangrovicus]